MSVMMLSHLLFALLALQTSFNLETSRFLHKFHFTETVALGSRVLLMCPLTSAMTQSFRSSGCGTKSPNDSGSGYKSWWEAPNWHKMVISTFGSVFSPPPTPPSLLAQRKRRVPIPHDAIRHRIHPSRPFRPPHPRFRGTPAR